MFCVPHVILRRCMALLLGCGVALLPARRVALLPARRVALLPARPVDLRAWGEGVVEYPGKVACPSGRRCSTRNAVWCHSHPGFKSQRYRHCRPAPMGPGGFVMPSWRAVWLCGCVAPRVFRAPEGPAAREARRPHFVRRRASKPARALRTLRRPSRQWGRVAVRARPSPAAAHGRRSQALRSLRRPSRQWGRVAVRARPSPAAAHGRRSQVSPPLVPRGVFRQSADPFGE